ncbi:MAG: hypothetical protein K5981_08750 [Clostridia bacterium]|nr:hypothetical protein [Clostridia bacterium]
MNGKVFLIPQILLAFAYSFRYLDTDLYYIIANGRYILENGLPAENPFVTTPGLNIVVQNWLYCDAVAFIHDHFHSLGLLLLQFAFLLLIVFGANEFLKRSGCDGLLKMGAVTLLIIDFSYTNLRPEMATFLLVLWYVMFYERYREDHNPLYIASAAFLMLLEINLHCSYWIMHFVMLLPYLAEDILKKRPGGITDFILYSIPSAFAIFANPYGTDGILYVFRSMKHAAFEMTFINEQGKFSIADGQSIVFIILTCVFILFLKQKKLELHEILSCAGCSVLFIMAAKWIAFYAFVILYIFRAALRHHAPLKHGFSGRMAIFPLTMCFIALIITAALETPANIFSPSSDEYIECASSDSLSMEGFYKIHEYLQLNDPDATVFGGFSGSNYFEYMGYKVYSDARPELYTEYMCGNDKFKGMMAVICGYSYGTFTPEEFGEKVDSIGTDYYVVISASPVLMQYIEDQPDKYESVLHTDTVRLYRNLQTRGE